MVLFWILVCFGFVAHLENGPRAAQHHQPPGVGDAAPLRQTAAQRRGVCQQPPVGRCEEYLGQHEVPVPRMPGEQWRHNVLLGFLIVFLF